MKHAFTHPCSCRARPPRRQSVEFMAGIQLDVGAQSKVLKFVYLLGSPVISTLLPFFWGGSLVKTE